MRPGNVHSADGWRDLLTPIVERYRDKGKKLYFRADAAFASPDVYEYLEGQGILYAVRLKGNPRLDKEIEHMMRRPVGRPPAKPQVFQEGLPIGRGGRVRGPVCENTGPNPQAEICTYLNPLLTQ